MSRTLGLIWKAIRPGERFWRAVCWLAFLGGAAVIAVGFVALCTGCTSTERQRAMTVMCTTATAALGPIGDQIRAEESACLSGNPGYADAKACVQASRAKWAPALAGVDALIVAGNAALDGDIDWAEVLRSYCSVREAYPKLPAPPALIGGCP